MYHYYQQTGGEDEWVPVKAKPFEEIEALKPTFITILALSHLISDDMKREDLAKIKYEGPMYFDFDAEDVMESVNGVKELLAKLDELGLEEGDIQLFLSGKKGLHLLIPPVVFMEKPGPVQNLPAIYKEMAFSLAVDTMDFRVYTGRRGRQFRTTYNVRENGNYKVAITINELNTITCSEDYNSLCKVFRPTVPGFAPKWRPKLGLVYDAATQKVGRVKAKPVKAVPPTILAEQLPQFTKLASGTQTTNKGFNIVGMQLALYARESGWTEEQFISACQGIIQKHQSDGIRYNTPGRRQRELRRMFNYIQENPAFEYSIGGIRSCFAREDVEYSETGEEESDDVSDFAGVYAGRTAYMAAKEDGDVPISNFVFRDVKILRALESDAIISIEAKIVMRKSIARTVAVVPASFTGGAALQNAVASFGGSFSGTDIHARGVYQAMLREVAEDQYVLDSEGVNLFHVGTGSTQKREYIVWADREGVRSAVDLKEEGFSVTFRGYPDPRGVIRTDLLAAPSLDDLCSTPAGLARFADSVEALCNAHTPEVMGKMLGWAAASFYAPLFQQRHKKFPLMHVYGPAGNGKTETVRGLLGMFFHREAPAETSPNSSVFALQMLVGGSASIPVLLDEYKPHAMQKDKLDQYRAVLRDIYNAKSVQRGGGSKSVTTNFNALSTVKLQAPLVFVGEAPETETAIVERSVMVSFRRLTGIAQSRCYNSALRFYSDPEPLSSLGLEIATKVVEANSTSGSLKVFDDALQWANQKFLPAADDAEKVSAGEMTQEEMRLRSIMRPRTVFNSTVSFFGLQLIKQILIARLGKEVYDDRFASLFMNMAKSCFVGMETLAAATLPEFVKVLTVFSDMTKLDSKDPHALVEGVDYNLAEYAGRPVVVVATAQAYRKYRTYMRNSGTIPLYPSEEAFAIAMREIPQFMKTAEGTQLLHATCMVFNAEELHRAGVPMWKGKSVSLAL